MISMLFTFMDIKALSTLPQQIEDQETAISCKGDSCRIPDEDITQQMNLGL